jgi:hypothetical protein
MNSVLELQSVQADNDSDDLLVSSLSALACGGWPPVFVEDR